MKVPWELLEGGVIGIEGACCLKIKVRRMLTLSIIKLLLDRLSPDFHVFLLFSWATVLILERSSASIAVSKFISSASLTRISWRILTNICDLVSCVLFLTIGNSSYNLLMGRFSKESQESNGTELSTRDWAEKTNFKFLDPTPN